jgi:hypothetical protein
LKVEGEMETTPNHRKRNYKESFDEIIVEEELFHEIINPFMIQFNLLNKNRIFSKESLV